MGNGARAEVHPYAHSIAGLFGDVAADTIPGKEARGCAIETWLSVTEGEGGAEQFLPKAIYYTLKAEFETGHLDRCGVNGALIARASILPTFWTSRAAFSGSSKCSRCSDAEAIPAG